MSMAACGAASSSLTHDLFHMPHKIMSTWFAACGANLSLSCACTAMCWPLLPLISLRWERGHQFAGSARSFFVLVMLEPWPHLERCLLVIVATSSWVDEFLQRCLACGMTWILTGLGAHRSMVSVDPPKTDSEHITAATQLWCEIFDNEETWLTASVCVTCFAIFWLALKGEGVSSMPETSNFLFKLAFSFNCGSFETKPAFPSSPPIDLIIVD